MTTAARTITATLSGWRRRDGRGVNAGTGRAVALSQVSKSSSARVFGGFIVRSPASAAPGSTAARTAPGLIPSGSDASSGVNPRTPTEINAARSFALSRPNAARTSSHAATPSSLRSRTRGAANGVSRRRNRSVARRRVTTSNQPTTGRSQSTDARRSHKRVNASCAMSSAAWRSLVHATGTGRRPATSRGTPCRSDARRRAGCRSSD